MEYLEIVVDTITIGTVVASQDLLDELQAALYDQPVRAVLEQREIGEWGEFLEKLDRVRPDVLLIDMTQIADPLEDVIRQIKATSGSPMVIVVHTSADPDTILKAIRADADEYVYPPLKDDLTAALRRMSADRLKHRAGTRPRGKVFGFLSAKGGCGATTLACHLAAELYRQTELQVLLADFDVDGGIVAFLMKTQHRYSVLDAVENVKRLDLSFWKALVSNGVPGVEVIAAPARPPSDNHHHPADFRDVLRFVRSNYDWTLVDLGSGLSLMPMTLLEELDQLFLVTTLDIPALHQAKNIVHTLHDLGYREHHLRLLVNRVPKRSEIGLSELERMLGVPVSDTVPNDYISLSDAYAEGGLLPHKSKIGKSCSKIIENVAGLKEFPKKKRSFLGF